ncbi:MULTISPECIES: LacI family DNA-binding transcriptional regulator [unclassified Variovorax]|uniref:LacI family DNA-binding transcriptional regulator n=1 Tax=unclassified Variovorax TaxID=663243 RepID=UPI002B223737|nr:MULTISPECIES: LacI family DNA-binding transcriptional regulator [unclassified Variovorax]MEB0055965.1 LacI family DNA-binding transcriptional regulator [Variovorax sp. LG9.2]MEB0111102.1 LacI family DNA-binding transcriptional regulator [Variovorax sp. RTB1]
MRVNPKAPPPPPGGPSTTRASVADIARAANVSTATVDRVLNRRSGVRDATAQRVLKAAGALDYLPETALYAALAPPPLRLSFLLPAGTNRFIRMLGDMVGYSQEHWAPFNVTCRAEFIEGFNPQALAAALLRHGKRSDGIAMMALEHAAVREAVNTLAQQGVPVITLISDLSNSARAAYIGLDNRAAGRTAGYLIGRFIGARTTAKVALIAGSRSYRAHEEREAGFQHVIDELFKRLEVVDLREGQDDAEKNYRQTRALLAQHPDLGGIYNIGGASDGVARALKEAGRDHKVVFVGHGLTPDTRALLIDGSLDAVITQSPQTTLMNCVRIFSNLRDRRDALSGIESTRSQVIFRENLP